MPHPGHVLTRVMKDVFLRYRTMCGYYVPRRAGWDTHGLPVEVEVEKELGISGREAIQEYGVEAFSRKCIDSVFKYIGEWQKMTERIGFWVDFDSAYVTFHKSYVESVWWALSEMFNQGSPLPGLQSRLVVATRWHSTLRWRGRSRLQDHRRPVRDDPLPRRRARSALRFSLGRRRLGRCPRTSRWPSTPRPTTRPWSSKTVSAWS